MDEASGILKDIEKKVRKTNNAKKFHLLYFTTYKVEVEKFHECCDGKGPTLTVLYGKNKTIFGEYTSKDWCSSNKMPKTDYSAFLFYKTNHPDAECIFLPIKQNDADRAITCDAKFGPTFGGGAYFWNGYDLQTFKKDSNPESKIKDDCMELNGTVNIGYAYEPMDVKGKEINSGKLLIKRIEIYQVVEIKPPQQIYWAIFVILGKTCEAFVGTFYSKYYSKLVKASRPSFYRTRSFTKRTLTEEITESYGKGEAPSECSDDISTPEKCV